MPNIIISAKVYGSQIKNFFKDLNIAFVNHDITTILPMLTEDIEWTMVSAGIVIKGKQSMKETLQKMNTHKTEALVIKNIIVDKDTACVDGEILLSNNKRYAFCDVYNFSNDGKPLVDRMKSFVIAIDSSS